MKTMGLLKLFLLFIAVLSLSLPKAMAMDEDELGRKKPQNQGSEQLTRDEQKKEFDGQDREASEEDTIIIDHQVLSESSRSNLLKKIIYWLLKKVFYVGFQQLDPSLASERRDELQFYYGARMLKCVNQEGVALDALYISSNSEKRTGNVLVICLNTTYQDHKPFHWEPFLDNGADIVLWNPSALGGVWYSRDLSVVLNTLREQNPDQVIAVKTYCAGSDPAIKAIADQNDDNIHLIIDRGYGDIKEVAKSFTVLAKLPIVQAVLHENFDCDGKNNIGKIKGKIFVMLALNDQVNNNGESNFTRDLWNLRRSEDSTAIHLESHDHWTHWDFGVYNQVLNFLSQLRVVQERPEQVDEHQFPTPPFPSYFAREWLPSLIKSSIYVLFIVSVSTLEQIWQISDSFIPPASGGNKFNRR